jgi:hypothetical protein
MSSTSAARSCRWDFKIWESLGIIYPDDILTDDTWEWYFNNPLLTDDILTDCIL